MLNLKSRAVFLRITSTGPVCEATNQFASASYPSAAVKNCMASCPYTTCISSLLSMSKRYTYIYMWVKQQ